MGKFHCKKPCGYVNAFILQLVVLLSKNKYEQCPIINFDIVFSYCIAVSCHSYLRYLPLEKKVLSFHPRKLYPILMETKGIFGMGIFFPIT